MPTQVVSELITEADRQLGSLGPSPFSAPAFENLKDKIARYIAEVIAESVKVAKRHRADTVSAAHVDQASDYLVSDASRRFFRHIGTIGGILLGASISNLLTMVTANQYSATSIGVTTALAIVGAFMIALHIAKD